MRICRFIEIPTELTFPKPIDGCHDALYSQRRNCGVRFVPAKSATPMERKNLFCILLYPSLTLDLRTLLLPLFLCAGVVGEKQGAQKIATNDGTPFRFALTTLFFARAMSAREKQPSMQTDLETEPIEKQIVLSVDSY